MAAITNEEEFNKIKETIVSKEVAATPIFHSDRFNELERLVTEALTRQESDRALSLVTR